MVIAMLMQSSYAFRRAYSPLTSTCVHTCLRTAEARPIVIEETTAAAFAALLHFLYSDALVVDDEFLVDVLRHSVALRTAVRRVASHHAAHRVATRRARCVTPCCVALCCLILSPCARRCGAWRHNVPRGIAARRRVVSPRYVLHCACVPLCRLVVR